MSATYKQIYTKLSLEDLWFFDEELSLLPNLYSVNRFQDQNKGLAEKYPGFVGLETPNPTTIEEMELRKNELRPDIYHKVFESTVEDPADLSIITVIDYIKKYNIPINSNPYANTYIEIFKFDTWENLIDAYKIEINPIIVDDISFKLAAYNNTLVEEFYIDDVKQDYPGVINN